MSTIQLAAPWRPRSDVEVVCRQLHAIERFHQVRRAAQAAETGPVTREGQLDAARAREVLQRAHEALVAHAGRQLAQTGAPWRTRVEPRVVVAHRNAWFAGKVAESLALHGVVVVAQLDNGADAIGVAVAEQPDLVLVEDALPMVPGPRVVAEVRDLCPEALVAAQVEHAGRMAPLLDAGAAAAFVRRQPPADVALALLELLRPAD